VQPDWFKEAIAVTPVDRQVEVEGARIHYLHWPNPGKPGLVFVHGHAAHAHWWDFIVPSFTESHDIIALDMSGSGDSDHRQQYRAHTFAKEIVETTRDARLVTPVVIGHSFGGAMTRIAAHLYPDEFSGIVIVDSVIATRKGSRIPPPMPRQRRRIYPDLRQGMRRFRLRPPQPCTNQYVVDHIAAHSLKQSADGFEFKYDSAVFAKMPADEELPIAAAMVSAMKMPVGFIYGELSRFFPEVIVNELKSLINDELIFKVDAAYHHVFLDQPLAFIDTLNQLLVRMDEHRRQS
jgi:pimeloyl-ACP methyl ester carboxylesterase